MRYSDYEEDFEYYDDYEEVGVRPKKKKGKRWLIVLSFVLAIAATAGATVAIFRETEKEQTSSVTLVQEGFSMSEERTLKLETPKGLYFKANVTESLKKEVEADEDKSFGFIVAPINYFVRVDTEASSKEINWAHALEEEKLAPLYLEDCQVQTKRNSEGEVLEYYIQDCITSILYKNTNVDFAAIAYVKTVDGEDISYKYASYPDGETYKSYAKSYAYVVSQVLNERALNGTYYAETDLEAMHKVINDSVDASNKLAEPTDDGSTYTVELSATEKTLEEGERFTLKAEIAEQVKLPICWISSNEEVVTVQNGVVKAIGQGKATVTAYVAGEAYTCEVEVVQPEQTEVEE